MKRLGIRQKVRQGFRQLPHPWRWLLLLAAIACLIRTLPLLAPIHAVDLVQDDRALEFVDRHGARLGTLLTRDRNHTMVVPLSEVSPHFRQAIVAAEDRNYYHHGALDLAAIGRAMLTSVRAGKVTSGASTIAMQLARMVDPTPSTLWGKVREVWTAWRLTAGMTKDEILQAYVNRLPMGGNIYGVEAAARIYFGIPAREVNIAQASLLAALPNDPTFLNPYEHMNALQERQRYVLSRMVADRYLTPEQARRSLSEAVTFLPRQQGIAAAPHFLFWAASQLPKQHASRLATTIDLPLQQFVDAQVRQTVSALSAHNVHHAAAIVLDNLTGEVLAYVGSPDYFEEGNGGRNDGVQALRQPGSTLKPFLYQMALEKRILRANTVLADVPTYYAIPNAQLYSPTDYTETFLGPVRVRLALANSLNVPAVRVLEKVGVGNFLDRLHQLGFAHLTHPADYYGLGLTLGSGEVSLWELARAYAAIARVGQLPALRFLMSDPIVREPNKKFPALAPATWELIADMLGDRHARAKSFGVDSVLDLPFATAAKTGTSSNFRDTWTVGFSTNYTVATWVGNFNGEPMRQVSGVMGSAPLWQSIMLHLHERLEPPPLPAPSGMVVRPVCALSGRKPTLACPAIVQEYFFPEDLAAYDREPDTFYQRTAAGVELNLPAEYREWLSRQPRSPLLPNAFQIVSPQANDYFIAHPGDSSQKLEFQLAAVPDRPVEWWLNGKKLATASDRSFFWELQPGTWMLEARSGDRRDRVNFAVGLAEEKDRRRGFSRVGKLRNDEMPQFPAVIQAIQCKQFCR